MRLVLRRVARAMFETGYHRPETSWTYALANGIESAWTVEGWRHMSDERADRYAGWSLARIVFVEAAHVLARHSGTTS